jgi:hypothetical protein
MRHIEFENRVVAVSPSGEVSIPDSYASWLELKAKGWKTEYHLVEKRGPDER